MYLCTGLNCPYQSSEKDVIEHIKDEFMATCIVPGLYYRFGTNEVNMIKLTARLKWSEVQPKAALLVPSLHLSHHFTNIKIINRRFLLLISGDIESNPGPEFDKEKCPCEEEINKRNVLFVTCMTCAGAEIKGG